MKTEGIRNPNQEGSQNEHKPSLKEKAVFQLKKFFGMFLYLWVLFALFDIHRSIILAQAHINYQAQGFAIINALILAKVMLIAESFPAIGGGGLQAILSVGAIVFVALIPFFAFREIGEVIGRRELWSLLLTRGKRIYALQARLQT